jgi:hypothetical protein
MLKSGQDIVVGVATPHWLDGWGFEPRWGRKIVSPPQPLSCGITIQRRRKCTKYGQNFIYAI